MSNIKACQCGCDAPTKSKFAPGHDSRLKGRLIRESRSSDPRVRETAVRAAREYGWTKYLDGDAVMGVPQRNADGRPTCYIYDVDMWHVDMTGMYHTHRKCRGASGPFVRWTIKHPGGWVACQHCTHDSTYLEDVEHEEARKMWSMVARVQAAEEDTLARKAKRAERPPSTGKLARGRV